MTRAEKCKAVLLAIRHRIHDLEVDALRREIAEETDVSKLMAMLDLWERRAEVEAHAINLRTLDREQARRLTEMEDEYGDKPCDMSDDELEANQTRLRDRIAKLVEACPESAKLGALDERG